MFSRVPFRIFIVSYSVTLGSTDPPELDHKNKKKNTIHQSRKPPTRSLFKFESELEAVFESYMSQFRPLIVFHQNTLMHQSTLIY